MWSGKRPPFCLGLNVFIQAVHCYGHNEHWFDSGSELVIQMVDKQCHSVMANIDSAQPGTKWPTFSCDIFKCISYN